MGWNFPALIRRFAPPSPGGRRESKDKNIMSKQNQWIAGINAVASAIENDADNVREILLEAGSKNSRITEIEENARRKGIEVRRVTQQALDGVG